MKKLLLLGVIIVWSSCSSTKQNKRYFDTEGIEITKGEFKKRRATNEYLDIVGDSTNHQKLIRREQRGMLNDVASFRNLITQQTGVILDTEEPLVILYYPGQDACNKTAFKDIDRINHFKEVLESGLSEMDLQPIYIYKDDTGLEKAKKVLEWHADPEGTVERLFFENHYPCESFVVVDKKGEYISYFGEYPMDYLWEAAQILAK